jgi:hypothetical protein
MVQKHFKQIESHAPFGNRLCLNLPWLDTSIHGPSLPLDMFEESSGVSQVRSAIRPRCSPKSGRREKA